MRTLKPMYYSVLPTILVDVACKYGFVSSSILLLLLSASTP